MSTLNSPVPLFQSALVSKEGRAVASFQNWLLSVYDKLKWSTFWNKLTAPATSLNLSAVAAPMTWDTTNVGLLAAAASSQGCAAVFEMPSSWKEGTLIYPCIRWQPTTAAPGNVLWGFDYKWTNLGEADTGSWETLGVYAAAGGNLVQQVASFPPIDGAEKTISSLLTVRAYRVGGDSGDTYPGSALFKAISIFYESDTFGSRNQFSK